MDDELFFRAYREFRTVNVMPVAAPTICPDGRIGRKCVADAGGVGPLMRNTNEAKFSVRRGASNFAFALIRRNFIISDGEK